MNAPASVPVTLTDEAQTCIQDLGLQEAYEEVLAHIQATVPRMQSITVEREPNDDGGQDDILMIQPTLASLGPDELLVEKEVGRWRCRTFPPEVRRYLLLFFREGSENAR